MTECPRNRCGYTYPENHELTDAPGHQHCCWRETVAGTERCIWHAAPEAVEKTPQSLREARGNKTNRRNGRPFGELLDGADLSGLKLDDSVSFRSVSLRDVDFSGTSLHTADFSYSLVARADFSGADLSDAVFETANLTRADFSGATLSGATLSPADLSEVTLDDATLRNANLMGADLGGADLQNATLTHSDLSRLPNASGEDWQTSLENADLSSANLSTADLSGANLTGADLTSVTSVDALFVEATLADVTLSDADFTGVDLTGVDFSGATLTDVTFSDAELTENTFEDATLSELDFRGVNSLNRVAFTNSKVSETKIGRGQIAEATNATFSDVSFYSTSFSDGVFTGVSLDRGTLSNVDLSGAQFDDAELFGSIEGTEGRTDPDSPGSNFIVPGSSDPVDISNADFTDSRINMVIGNVEGRADFTSADLSGCEVDNSDFSGSLFHSSAAIGAEFFDTNFSNAEFNNVNFSAVEFGEDCIFSGAKFKRAILSHGNLTRCDFTDVNLHDAVLVGARCADADFSEARLANADLSAAYLGGANFSKSELVDADFGGEYLFSIDLAPEDMDLVFVCYEQGEHYYVGATLPDDSIDTSAIDAVVRHTETDYMSGGSTSDHLIFLNSDAESFNSNSFDIVDVKKENMIGAFADFRDLSALEESDSDRFLFHEEVDEFSFEELHSDLIFVSLDISKPDNIEVCGINLSDLELHDIDSALHDDLRDWNRTATEDPSPYLFNPSTVSQRGENALHFVDQQSVDSDCDDISPTYTVAPEATFDSAIATGIDGTADFSYGYFSNADFIKATLRDVDFTSSELSEASLTETDLEDATFDEANLSEASLIAADCEGCSFENAVLTRASLENADLVRANISDSYLFATQFDGATISSQTKFVEAGPVGDANTDHRCRYDTDVPPDGPRQSLTIDEDNLESRGESPRAIQLRRARSTYRRLENLARQNGFPSLQSTMFKRRQEMRRNLLQEQDRRREYLFTEVQRWLFVYGESFSRVLGISVGVVAFFWILFLTTATVQTTGGETVTVSAVITEPVLIWESLYHSILVFFTGSGLFTPTGIAGQLFTAVESLSGPILLALLIFVLGRRAAR